ncbi:FKBP-type peptidyl-prolyl cis-trans isomerase [Pseudonocardia xishanensis]|uniref:Peptidyl-prolyl cis-trans isomerase n=1 Tax=Pseudonocardia xishanensis TaxID=630995 RepID=A0ABP8RKG8_9PSEU
MRALGKIVLAAAAVAALASCSSPAPAAAPTAAAPAAAPSAAVLPVCTADDIVVGGAPGTRPTITVPDTCAPPTQLLSKDLLVGPGAEVVPGSTLLTNYDLVTWSDKRELDASWNRGEPFALEDVGRAPVIDGWNEGVVGMREGGRRLLVIPPDKGYGAGGRGIAPNETLVFVLDAVTVTP